MEQSIVLRTIGKVSQKKGFSITLDEHYRKALSGLEEFSHVMILWGFNKYPWDEKTLTMPPPYKRLDHEIGIFATRSPFRPSSIAVSTARLLTLNIAEGILELDWIDADEGSPVFDIKPYHPSEDLVRDIQLPKWCAHWPRCREESADFDWENEFTF